MHQRAETGVHQLSERSDAGVFDHSWPGAKELFLHHRMLNPGCSINTQDNTDDRRGLER